MVPLGATIKKEMFCVKECAVTVLLSNLFGCIYLKVFHLAQRVLWESGKGIVNSTKNKKKIHSVRNISLV